MTDSPRVWLITGATSGFGAAITAAALDAGDIVVAAVRRPEAVTDHRVETVALDVTRSDQIPSVVEEVLGEHGRIDVLVNNAGRGHLGAVEETTDEELRSLLDLHLIGPAALTKQVLPSMRERGTGAIVQLSSMGGRTVFPGVGGYGASKYALEAWSEALAAEVEGFGITVLIVEPGAFRTGFNRTGAISTSTPMSVYDDQIGPLRDSFAATDGQQPGDPAKAAAAILTALAADRPPLRLVLGSDAVTAIGDTLRRQQAELESWQDLSRTTDFDEQPDRTRG